MISLYYTSHTKTYNTIYTACNIVEAIYSFTPGQCKNNQYVLCNENTTYMKAIWKLYLTAQKQIQSLSLNCVEKCKKSPVTLKNSDYIVLFHCHNAEHQHVTAHLGARPIA